MNSNKILLLGFLALAGCVTRPIRTSMGDYGEIYADSSNRQLLLNLARLDNRHPPFFFQMGQVSVLYNSAASLSAMGPNKNSYWDSPFTGTGTATISGSQAPTFTFVPLSGTNFSDQLLHPLSTQVFYALFQQGFPVDILLRVCVQRIEFTRAVNTSTAGQIKTNRYSLRNDATVSNSTDYESFLRTCDLLRELQNRNLLHLRPRTKYEPVDDVVSTNQPDEKGQLDAIEKGFVWHRGTDEKWRVCQKIEQPVLIVNIDDIKAEANLHELSTNDYYNEKGTLTNVLELLINPESSSGSLALEMRAPLAAVALAAREQRDFEENTNLCNRIASIAPNQRHPVLVTRWDANHRQKWDKRPQLPNPGFELVSLTYRGTQYTIADELAADGSEAEIWNRYGFFLLHVLMAQSDVDVTKINYQGYLQLR